MGPFAATFELALILLPLAAHILFGLLALATPLIGLINHFFPAKPYDLAADPESEMNNPAAAAARTKTKPKRPDLSRYRVSQEDFSKRFRPVLVEEEKEDEWFDAVEYLREEDWGRGSGRRGMPLPLVKVTYHR